jgi:hypothetical protein
MLYKQILNPSGRMVYSYVEVPNRLIIQRFQNKVFRNIVDAPRYVRNNQLHRDLETDTVDKEIKRFARKHEDRLH